MFQKNKSNLKKILKKIGKIFKWFGIFLILLLSMLLGMIIYWLTRPNTSEINYSLGMEYWIAMGLEIEGHSHNSNTDMIFWNGSFYLVHQNSPYHLTSKQSKLIIWRSSDAISWELVKIIYLHEDIRDPKFAIIGSRLFMYALVNYGEFIASPETTIYTYTEDGQSWKDFKFIEPYGWLFWRPKTRDNKTWYVPAYWRGHGASILLNSTDGINWEFVSTIFLGERNDETDIEFFPDGRMISTGRLEGESEFLFGDNSGSTGIAVSKFPYKSWTYFKSQITRLDGPCLFEYSGKIFAVGRYEPQNDPVFHQQGSFFNRKRTSLFQVTEIGLVYLADLPSCGDTSYAGVVIRGDQAYISYYSSPINQDLPWILGVISKSEIRMAKIDLDRLESLANAKLLQGVNNKRNIELPWQDYIIFSLIIIIQISIMYILKRLTPFSKRNKRKNKKFSQKLVKILIEWDF
ncbi:MAG: hypothetical protein ACFFCM_01155 [Promethearchaeota archaeon]